MEQGSGRRVNRRRRTVPTSKKTDVQGWSAQWPYLVVLTALIVGLLTCWSSYKAGALLISAGLLFGAGARFAMPESRVGFLATRRRWPDVITMAVLGLGIGVLALITKAT
ncbi:hypothetical protein GCM10027589_20610 [Actinocorallia lasiicapitis]